MVEVVHVDPDLGGHVVEVRLGQTLDQQAVGKVGQVDANDGEGVSGRISSVSRDVDVEWGNWTREDYLEAQSLVHQKSA